jgi:RHS repeat-associated protein
VSRCTKSRNRSRSSWRRIAALQTSPDVPGFPGSLLHRARSEVRRAGKVRENARGVCVARWYDPGTGEFMSVDPDLAETGQPYAYAGDDPVNEADPSGDAIAPAPIMVPPTAPGFSPSATSYLYSFDLGTLGTPSAVATFVDADCASVFPISGCDDDFYQGEDMLLQKKAPFGLYTQSFPVQVVTVASAYFTFVALKGHPEGEGRTITFSFSQASSCQDLFLHVYTSKSGSALTQWYGVRTVDFWIAHGTWADFALNIRKYYPWWAEQNPNGPPIKV